ncbi:MAG: response regulator [Phycisphaerales bacterium]
MRVLLVEDSDTIRNSLTQALREAGYAVDAVADGRRALTHLRTSDYDAAVVDWGLPELDGLSLLSQAREKGVRTPVLMLTARDAIDDRVRALSTGADDYIVKPFALAELKARLQAVIRRASGHARSVVTIGPLVIDAGSRRVTAHGRPLEGLTPREQSLLEYLAHRAGKPVPRRTRRTPLRRPHPRAQQRRRLRRLLTSRQARGRGLSGPHQDPPQTRLRPHCGPR